MKKKTFLLTVVAILGFATVTLAQVPNYLPENGLIGWWPFNGNANDESGNGNNGTVIGSTLTSDRFGNVNKAYKFNGNGQYISVANSASLNPKHLSMNVWFNTNQITSDKHLISKLNRVNAENMSYTLSFLPDKITTHWSNKGCGLVPGTFSPSVTANVTVPKNSWLMVTSTIDSIGNCSTYLNGKLVQSFKTNYVFNACNDVTSKLQFGTWWQGDPQWFDGIIDDIGLWKRVLNQQEITDLFNGNVCYQNIAVTDTLFINTNLTNLNPAKYQNTIKVYPNPTKDHITIDNGNIASLVGYQLKITNSLGQQMFQSQINQQQFYISLKNWTGNGIYFVYIIDKQGYTIEVKKIVLQ